MWLRIEKPGTTVIRCVHSPDVVLRRLRIEHAPDGVGIRFDGCDRIRIEDVSVSALSGSSYRRPSQCKLRHSDCDNIHGLRSADVRIERVRLAGGASGVELHACPRAALRSLVVFNVLGPYPRGQCVQFSASPDGVLDTFYCRNDPYHSWVEDSISVWRSARVRVSNGLLDGNNSPTGVGVMFENDDAQALGGAIDSVDAIHMGNGCFSAWPARDLAMTKTRCGWNHCEGSGGRPRPASGGQMWAAGQPTRLDKHEVQQLRSSRKAQRALNLSREALVLHDWSIASRGVAVSQSRFWAACNSTKPASWAQPADAFSHVHIKRREFVPRTPLELTFCWEQAEMSGGGTVGYAPASRAAGPRAKRPRQRAAHDRRGPATDDQ